MAMEVKDGNSAPGVRRTYEKPAIRQVPLRPEEAVLGFCRSSSGGVGPGSFSCLNLNCRSIGS